MSYDPTVVKDWIFPVIEALASIAAIILVLIVWRQVKQTDEQLKMTQKHLEMTKDEMDVTLRPWLAIEHAGVGFEPENNRVYVRYKNYGQTPATNVRARALASFIEVTEELVKNREYTPGISTLVPDASRVVTFDMKESVRDKLLSKESYMWVGIFVEYAYGKDQRGEYMMIGEYNFIAGHDKTHVEWTR